MKTAGIAGGVILASSAVSAKDFASKLVSNSAASCESVDGFYREEIEGACQINPTVFVSDSKQFFTGTNEEILAGMTDLKAYDYRNLYALGGKFRDFIVQDFKENSERMCKLIYEGANQHYYPKVDRVTCVPSSPIMEVTTKEYRIEITDSDKFPSTQFKIHNRGEGTSYETTLSEFGDIVTAQRKSGVGSLDLINGPRRQAKIGLLEIGDNQVHLGVMRGILQRHLATLTEAQSCCRDTSPRPSSADCSKYKISLRDDPEVNQKSKAVR